jgi:GNAT superfamily N-acetyltransferase
MKGQTHVDRADKGADRTMTDEHTPPRYIPAVGVSADARRLRISPATRGDIPAILGMIRELAEYERLRHLCVSTEADLERALFSTPVRAEVLVGTESGVPVCFALFFYNFSTFLGKPGLYLEDLFVRPAHRRKGYGRAMLIALAALARERDCGRFEWSVLDWNEPAIRFYESLGASVLPDWRITRVTGDALDRLAGLGRDDLHEQPKGI